MSAGSLPLERAAGSPGRANLPDELSLCRLWNAGRLPDRCRTTEGEPISVVYRGQWSHGYGPDFRNAILCLGEGAPIRGDVEVHVTSAGWYSHGHSSNPMYDCVVLHVVWLADAQLPAPVLELAPHVPQEWLRELPDLGALDNSPCSVFQAPDSAERAISVIEAAGDERFEARCAALEGDLACEQPEQVLYMGLMECMGYSENKLPFRLLAAALPYRVVADARPERISAALLDASGLQSARAGSALLEAHQWSLARVRPANHPARRIDGLARVLAMAEARGGPVEHLVYDGVGSGAGGLLDRLRAASPAGLALIGADRANATAVNAVLPFAIALARLRGDTVLEGTALEVWRSLPRAAPNRIERSMLDHIGSPRLRGQLGGARHQQGLLHLYKRYCAQRLCRSCPLSRLAGHGA